MYAFEQHEIFEIEVLDQLKKAGFLGSLVFGGGTMLRLCHELPRYSVDLDFWFSRKTAYKVFFKKLGHWLGAHYELSDIKDKHATLLYEIRGGGRERKLKLEIRKEVLDRGLESKIAFSNYAAKQILVTALSLEESAKRKLLAARERTEIRDFFDLEFLLRKGALKIPKKEKARLIDKIRHFTKNDYRVILGSLLEKDLRDHYAKHGFTYLLNAIEEGVG